jgi:hypothetical protein
MARSECWREAPTRSRAVECSRAPPPRTAPGRGSAVRRSPTPSSASWPSSCPTWGDRPTGRTPGDVGTAGRLRGVSERRHAPCAHAAARGLTGRPPRIAGRAMVRGSAAWRCSAVGEFRERRARLGPSTGRARMDASLPPGDGAVGGGRGVSLVGPTPVDGDRSPKLGVLRRRRFGHVVPPAPEPPSWNCAHGSHQVGDRRPQAGLGTVGVRPAGSSARTWRRTSRPAA